jgi:protocatechuate 3,4-dioxygenase beta subunit
MTTPEKPTVTRDPLTLAAAANRRTMLKASAAALGVGALGSRIAPALAQSGESTATTCILTPQMTAGPFYVPNELVRADITEGSPGLPLTLRIAVQDVASCSPLANAAVDIWHCNAAGIYSGVTGENPGGGTSDPGAENVDTTFLRGVQVTDDDGIVEFATIYPGWYGGRTVHIHLKVITDGDVASGDPAGPETTGDIYEGGQDIHTGQLFFDDAVSDEVYQLAPYNQRTGNRTHNEQDGILGGNLDEPGFMLDLSRASEESLDDGLVGTITLGVNRQQ